MSIYKRRQEFNHYESGYTAYEVITAMWLKMGYQQFGGRKQEMISKRKLKKIADWLCLFIEVAIFKTFGYYSLPI